MPEGVTLSPAAYLEGASDGRPDHRPEREKESHALIARAAEKRAGAWLLSASLALNTLLVVVLVPFVLQTVREKTVGSHSSVESSICGTGTVVDHSFEPCHGNGILFADSEVCTCFDCWTGDTCTEELKGSACLVDASSGTPYIFEEYWVQHPSAIVTIKPSYHIGYGYEMPQLEAAIREMHSLVGNAQTDGMQITIGVGSTQLISAALYALAIENGDPSQPSVIWSQKPYYSGYNLPPGILDRNLLVWNESDVPPSSGHVIELVTSPNNPDGKQRRPLSEPHRRGVIMDHAYYWPHFVGISAPVRYSNDTIALFTLSKLTGHASSRIGIADAMGAYIEAEGGSPRENRLRAIAVLEDALRHPGEMFSFARARMLSRWERLDAVFAGSKKFSLQSRDPPTADLFSGVTSGYVASPAYAWIEMLSGGDAYTTMMQAGIRGRAGPKFGAHRRFVRLELLMREQTFDLLLAKLINLLRD